MIRKCAFVLLSVFLRQYGASPQPSWIHWGYSGLRAVDYIGPNLSGLSVLSNVANHTSGGVGTITYGGA